MHLCIASAIIKKARKENQSICNSDLQSTFSSCQIIDWSPYSFFNALIIKALPVASGTCSIREETELSLKLETFSVERRDSHAPASFIG